MASAQVDQTRFFLIGDPERRNRLLFPIRVAITNYQGSISIGYFTSNEEYHDYITKYMNIKNVIATLNDEHQANRITDAEYRIALLNTWIPLTEDFENVWGASFVISDVRSAIDEVRAHLYLPARNWPAMVEVTLEEIGE